MRPFVEKRTRTQEQWKKGEKTIAKTAILNKKTLRKRVEEK